MDIGEDENSLDDDDDDDDNGGFGGEYDDDDDDDDDGGGGGGGGGANSCPWLNGHLDPFLQPSGKLKKAQGFPPPGPSPLNKIYFDFFFSAADIFSFYLFYI